MDRSDCRVAYQAHFSNIQPGRKMPMTANIPVTYTKVRRDIQRSWQAQAVTKPMLLVGLLTMAFQVVQVAIAQPGHIWMLAALSILAVSRSLRFTAIELFSFVCFLYFAVAFTFLQDFPRVKQYEQLAKFGFFYPGFYIVGRSLGDRFLNRRLPFGYAFLLVFLLFQYGVQYLEVPVIYQEIDFGQGALHGTFKERNWLAVYFCLASYFLLLKDKSRWRFVPFFILNSIVMLLSGSKTTFVACGIVYLLQSKLPTWLKIVPLAIGVLFYAYFMSGEFTQDKMAVKLEEERGLAMNASISLIEKNPLGYGFGFVEGYFASSSITVRGLGEGVNSVFSVPLDLWLIAGPAGLFMWLVVFVGVGNASMRILAPVAALSLLNPLHQSELVYFFIGLILSQSHIRHPHNRHAFRNSSEQARSSRSTWGGRKKIDI